MIKLNREIIHDYINATCIEYNQDIDFHLIDVCITICQREANKQIGEILAINPELVKVKQPDS